MKYETKLALQIFIIGTIILSIGLYATYRYNYSTIVQQELHHTASIVDEVSVNFGQQLIEKIKTNQTLSIVPILINAVKTSNSTLRNFSEKERNEIIHHQNEKWQAIKDENNAFILEYTDNNAAQFLKAQQNNLKGEYGEIFLTNKYGALVASTSKLTTLAHAHKYWWQGAYNNGLGTVFIDDRGYDESVNGYVLGLVIPVKEDDQIIGMLKVNLNILGVISEMILSSQSDDAGDFKLIRSGGEIIFEEGISSLTTRIPDLLYNKLQFVDEHSLLFYDSDKKWMIGKSEISITSKDTKGSTFGGSFKSKDHQRGNSEESWFIINYRELATIIKPFNDSISILLSIGFLLIIILAFTAFIFGKTTIKPLKKIIDQSKKIAKSDFSGRIVVTRKDEVGLLGEAFNKMAEELEKTTTSITNLELSEEKIKESENRFKTVFYTNPDAININRLKDGSYTDVNEGFTLLTGYTRKDVIGKTSKEINIWLNQTDRQELVRGLKEKGCYTNLEAKFQRKDGSITTALMSASIIDLKGVAHIISITRDISEKQKLEDSLQKTQKLESLGVLAGGIAHDFNNILSAIFGFTELAIMKTSESAVSTYLNKSLKNTERARALTQQLLTFAKGGIPVKKVAQLFPFVQETVQFALSGSSVSSKFQIQDNLWACDLDKNQIGQVIDNLTINAQQAMPSGGTIKVSAQNISLSEKEHPPLMAGNYVKLSIKDQGIGIPKEFLPRIFDPYYTTKPKGHGLGLATCYSIINRHDGIIDVESESGKGSTFNIYLPATIDTISTRDEKLAKQHSGSGTFLIMDDEKAILDMMKKMLESFGYNVVVKTNGAEAIDFFAAEFKANRKIAGMIFDITVPGGMGGKEAVKEIRKMCSDTPVFVASGYSEDPIISNPEEYGFNGSIRKPFMLADLSDMLEKHRKI